MGGRALFGVNVRPLQVIEAIMGDGRIFLFRETRVLLTKEEINTSGVVHIM